jgi:hypothetical protein
MGILFSSKLNVLSYRRYFRDERIPRTNLKSVKLQYPNNKQITNSNTQFPNVWDFEFWSLGFIWDLGFKLDYLTKALN